MKRLILCADNRTPYTDEDVFYKHCIQSTKKYAQEKGIDFRFELLTAMEDGRYWPWLKIKSILKYVDDYDEILWIDSDASIFHHEVNVFDVIRNGPTYTPWVRNKDVLPIIYMLKDCGKGLCTGIFLVDCTNKQKTKMVLNRWWNDMHDSRYKTVFPWEQYVINDVWSKEEESSNFIKGVDIWSFSLLDSRQAFLHITSGLYRYHQQLHEAKRLTIPQKHETIGILVSLTNIEKYALKKRELELQGYIVWFLVEQSSPGLFNTIYRNYNIHYIGINDKSYHSPIRQIYYDGVKPSVELAAKIAALGVRMTPIDNTLIWAPLLVERVVSPYTTTSDRLELILHAKDEPSLRMAAVYATCITAGKPTIHIYGGVTPLLCGFENLTFHTEDLEFLLRKLELRKTRLVVLSYQSVPCIDYQHYEVTYRGIPLLHNSPMSIGYSYKTLDDIRTHISDMGLKSLSL